MKIITPPTALLALALGSSLLSACVPSSMTGNAESRAENAGLIERVAPPLTEEATVPSPEAEAEPAEAAPTLESIAESALQVTESNIEGKPEAAEAARQTLQDQLNTRVRQLAAESESAASLPQDGGEIIWSNEPPATPKTERRQPRPSLEAIAVQAIQWADSLSEGNSARQEEQAELVREMMQQRVRQSR